MPNGFHATRRVIEFARIGIGSISNPSREGGMSDDERSRSESAQTGGDQFVPDDVIPHGKLPPMRYRDLPPAVPLRKMLGPSIILAGLSLGSGEFLLWPYITYKSQFVFFWACLLGVSMQYVINMEITRWTLATGESAVAGFARLSKHWAWAFLIFNIVPHMIPAWARGAAEVISWLISDPILTIDAATGLYRVEDSPYVAYLAIGGMVLCGIVLTAGPVIYETIERVQMTLVTIVLILVVVLAAMVVRSDSVWAMVNSTATLGWPDFVPRSDTPFTANLNATLLLGALAFAGCGGTLNLGQGNYIKDKGYGMGRYIGRITSPITGKDEPVAEIGFHFPATEENAARWRSWFRSASLEHFFSFFCTCVVCLVLLTLISHSLFYQPDGTLRAGAENYSDKMDFVVGEANEIDARIGSTARILFLLMGVAILFTTEIGVLDAASRISTDIVKVNWLRENAKWSEGRLYYVFLWGMIGLASLIVLLERSQVNINALSLFKFTSAMSGGVMFLYSGLLIYLNRRKLPQAIRMSLPRTLAMGGVVLFFGFFAGWAVIVTIEKLFS
jgi:hypothetical protein